MYHLQSALSPSLPHFPLLPHSCFLKITSPNSEGGLLIGGSDNNLIYRHYATLYFAFCVDSSKSKLGILDLIQVSVETLDERFENVCELYSIVHVDKVHPILAELVMGEWYWGPTGTR